MRLLLLSSSLLIAGAMATLYQGAGEGTFYYNAGGTACGLDSSQDQGSAFCESWQEPESNKTLTDYNNNFIVALDQEAMQQPRQDLCGKRVIVMFNGQVVRGDFVVWDSCTECVGGGRLDFSAMALQTIDANACITGVVQGLSWEVVEDQLMEFLP